MFTQSCFLFQCLRLFLGNLFPVWPSLVFAAGLSPYLGCGGLSVVTAAQEQKNFLLRKIKNKEPDLVIHSQLLEKQPLNSPWILFCFLVQTSQALCPLWKQNDRWAVRKTKTGEWGKMLCNAQGQAALPCTLLTGRSVERHSFSFFATFH